MSQRLTSRIVKVSDVASHLLAVRHRSVLAWVSWRYRTWVNRRPVWNFWDWFVRYNLSWVVRVSWVSWSWCIWNFVSIRVNWNQLAVWSIYHSVFDIRVIYRSSQATCNLLISVVAFLKWRVFLAKGLSTRPVGSLDNFARYLVDSLGSREGLAITLYLIIKDLSALVVNVVDSLGSLLVQSLIFVSVNEVNEVIITINLKFGRAVFKVVRY